jgi:HPt (histidine-containing phosphotransfer) domain-containing protein
MLKQRSHQESPPLDVEELLDRCMGNMELAERILAKLQSRFPDDITELDAALQSRDAGLVASIAHRLKGAAANVAAHQLQDCAATIEESARNDRIDAIPDQIECLQEQWTKLKQLTSCGLPRPRTPLI